MAERIERFPWPEGNRAAAAASFEVDADPVMLAAGLRATFFVLARATGRSLEAVAALLGRILEGPTAWEALGAIVGRLAM